MGMSGSGSGTTSAILNSASFSWVTGFFNCSYGGDTGNPLVTLWRATSQCKPVGSAWSKPSPSMSVCSSSAAQCAVSCP
jgi:hypothetical protein